MTDRNDILNQLKTWSVGDIRVAGEEDQARFQKFYDENPEFKEAILERFSERQARQALEDELEWRRRQDPGVLKRMRQMHEVIAEKTASQAAANAPAKLGAN